MSAAEAVVGLVGMVEINAGIGRIRLALLRPAVEDWLRERGWTPWQVAGADPWLLPRRHARFHVEALEPSGRAWTGHVIAAGLIRRRVFFD